MVILPTMNEPCLLLLIVATLFSNGMAFVGRNPSLLAYKQTSLSSHRDESSSEVDRRSFLSVPLSSVILAAGLPSNANAAKGAAEYDLEYYMRDLFMGNKKEGNLPVSSAPPAAPPRTLREPLLPLLLDDEVQSSIPIQELSRTTKIPIGSLAEQVTAFRTKVAPAFQASHPWQKESVSDEYYFDLTCYALWKVASTTIQDYSNDEERSGLKVFDELDDDEISSPNGAGSVNCLVSIFDPATLGGALQITGEGSRFSPDFVGPTLAALFERVGNCAVNFESYFVDPVYRPNPKDFFPNERFYQFTIARKS
ncbi:hypothetical protein ACHAWT_009168 [Skeletonema menzelii]